MIVKLCWHERHVLVNRHITGHRGDKRDPSAKGKDTGSKKARRRHRDKTLHSNAFMHIEWNGKPSELAAKIDVQKGFRYELRADLGDQIPPFVRSPLNPRHRGAFLAAPDPEPLPSQDLEERAAARKQMSFYERQRHDRDAETLASDLQRVTTVATSRKRNPVTLWINQDCRQITLRYFDKAFALPGSDSEKHPTQVYFNFKTDTLMIPRHVQLWRTFTKLDLSKLVRVSIPEAVLDNSGDFKAVAKVVDELYSTDMDGKSLLHRGGWMWLPDKTTDDSRGEWLSTASRSEQTEWMMKDSLEMLNALMPSLKMLYLSPHETCKLAKNLSTAKCHIKHRGSGGTSLDNLLAIDNATDGDNWSTIHVVRAAPDRNDHPGVDLSYLDLPQVWVSKATADREGKMKKLELKMNNGGTVVMKCVNHDLLPQLETWEPQMRIPSWGRSITQVQAADKNLKWILEMSGTGHRRCETLDYEL